MRWLVGLDLRTSEGAVRLGSWLSRATGGRHELVGVHVIEDQELNVVVRFRHVDEVVQGTRDALQRQLERIGAAGAFSSVRVIPGGAAEDRLEETARELACDAIVIGRAARRDEHRLVRLGRVARRLLRRLPVPVVVVAPDLTEAELGDGPVVALTRLTPDSAVTLRFADRLARELSRRRVALHVIPDPRDAAQYGLPDDAVERLRAAEARAADGALAAWIEANHLEVDEREILVGNVVEEASAFADRVRAPILLAGARPPRGLAGAAAASLARELAATARVSVAVVPPAR